MNLWYPFKNNIFQKNWRTRSKHLSATNLFYASFPIAACIEVSSTLPSSSMEYHRHIISLFFCILTSNRSLPVVEPAETRWGGAKRSANWLIHTFPATIAVMSRMRIFLIPATHTQGAGTVSLPAHLSLHSHSLQVQHYIDLVLKKQFRNKTQGCIRQFIKPSHSQKSWYLHSTEKLPSATSFLRCSQCFPQSERGKNRENKKDK